LETKLFTKNFILLTAASIMGSAGGIAGGFALSFFVFDETGSTLASALVMSIQLLPHIFVPFLAAPIMDRLPRLAFLVGGDAANGIIYAAMGLWLMFFKFSYTGYLAVSLVLACLGAVDQLAYISIYPELLPKGAEQKGFAVSTMLYPVLSVIMMPLAAVLLDTLGVARLLIAQGGLSIAAAVTESFIKLDESEKKMREPYSFKAWADDIKEGLNYFKRERGLRSVYTYMAVSNGVASGLYPILVAFFRSFPGMTAAMYSFFSAVEFIGRTIGSAVQYRIKVPKKKKFGFILFVYQAYAVMDMILLWIPYPLMLLNRGICGFLGNNSAIMREAAVQIYIPSNLRARVNALNNVLITFGASVFSLLIGLLGEVLDYRLCMSVGGALTLTASTILIWGGRKDVRKIYEFGDEQAAARLGV
jgi:DHA3 family macrolide efflux protein-like MFS transporter